MDEENQFLLIGRRQHTDDLMFVTDYEDISITGQFHRKDCCPGSQFELHYKRECEISKGYCGGFLGEDPAKGKWPSVKTQKLIHDGVTMATWCFDTDSVVSLILPKFLRHIGVPNKNNSIYMARNTCHRSCIPFQERKNASVLRYSNGCLKDVGCNCIPFQLPKS